MLPIRCTLKKLSPTPSANYCRIVRWSPETDLTGLVGPQNHTTLSSYVTRKMPDVNSRQSRNDLDKADSNC